MIDAEFMRLLRPFLKYVGDSYISPDQHLRDLGLDSMGAIDLLFAVEDAYGVIIPDELLTDATFETGRALWSVVRQLMTAPADSE